jgi:hypothetical protein
MSSGFFLDPVFSSFENKKEETIGVEQMRKRIKELHMIQFFRLMRPIITKNTKRIKGESNAGSNLWR